jgi:hypothetical protein
MQPSGSLKVPLAWSVIGVPLLFALALVIAHQVRAVPFLGGREWLWWASFGIALSIGVATLLSVQRWRLHERIIAAVAYIALMGPALLAIGLFVSCANGDCL